MTVSTTNAFDFAHGVALTQLGQESDLTIERVREVATGAAAMQLHLGNGDVDVEALVRRLESEVSVWQPEQTVLGSDEGHEAWLGGRRDGIDWRFWEAYRSWTAKSLPPRVVSRLDEFTDDVLGRLEDPRRPGPWDRRGMVVGQVQSGKTGNYTGLICKAADAGYPFIVVLAGLHNSLRSQTQQRLDEGFLGFDSANKLRGRSSGAVGAAQNRSGHPAVYTLTSSEESGDFSRKVAQTVAGRIGKDPVLLVVKKNKSILENLIAWVTEVNAGPPDPETGHRRVSNFPLLVIDDEADNASVNTKNIERTTDADGVSSETDPSAINGLIRRLLNSFDRSSLVSYTATPFANIFIDAERHADPRTGEDLFPRSFILRLPPPENYVGPAEVFGVRRANEQTVPTAGMRVIRTAEDHGDWMPTGHRKEHVPPTALPASLREGIRAFVLVCAARAARGQRGKHNSMLIHVTRFVDVQSLVHDQVLAELDVLKRALRYGEETTSVLGELRSLWERDFVRTTDGMAGAPDPTAWGEIEAELAFVAPRIETMQINGTAGDALRYQERPDGLDVIAIGGDKLSRGLTLEGLSVSYYLRASKMYDTLMQMGRWFGYRPGYQDLIRLYTTGELEHWYRDITVANEELHETFDEMARVNSNPEDFALKVRKSPAGLLVTARSKMRTGRTMELSFSGEIVETITFATDPAVQQRNLDATVTFLETLAAEHDVRPNRSGDRLWRDVGGRRVADYLSGISSPREARKANGSLLADYVRAQVAKGELDSWDVLLKSNSSAPEAKRIKIAGSEAGLTFRQQHGDIDDGCYRMRRLASPSDEEAGLDTVSKARALERTVHAWQAARAEGKARQEAAPTTASGPQLRRTRNPRNGLLVIYLLDPKPYKGDTPPIESLTRLADVEAVPGFAVAFPFSDNATNVSYVIPERYWETDA